MYFQELILKLHEFWSKQGCVLLQPYDIEVGAGTFHPATFFKVLGPSRGKQLMLNLQEGLQTADTVRTRTGFSIITSIR